MTDEEFQAKVARIAAGVLETELAEYPVIAGPRGIRRLDDEGRAKLIAQIAEHIAAVVARETM